VAQVWCETSSRRGESSYCGVCPFGKGETFVEVCRGGEGWREPVSKPSNFGLGVEKLPVQVYGGPAGRGERLVGGSPMNEFCLGDREGDGSSAGQSLQSYK
jgi:hypothetical protein